MQFLSIIKHIIKSTLNAGKSFLTYNDVKGFIFMLHRVGDINKNKLPQNENMKISPEFLDKQLTILEKKFDFISLEEAAKRLKSENTYKRKFVVFTMDDGYLDNYTNALPVFQKHNCPYTIFITSNFPNNKAILWWYVIEDLILNNIEIKICVDSNDIILDCSSFDKKSDCFMYLRSLILTLDQTNLEKELNKLFINYNIDWNSKCSELSLSWNDIKVLVNTNLVSIGGHTSNHYNLKKLDFKEDVRKEVTQGTMEISNKTKIDVKTFAYPYGSWNEVSQREIDVLSETGLNCACLSFGGPCLRTSNIYALPRINFTKNFSVKKLPFIEHEKIKL